MDQAATELQLAFQDSPSPLAATLLGALRDPERFTSAWMVPAEAGDLVRNEHLTLIQHEALIDAINALHVWIVEHHDALPKHAVLVSDTMHDLQALLAAQLHNLKRTHP